MRMSKKLTKKPEMKHPNDTFNLFKSLGFDKVMLQKKN